MTSSATTASTSSDTAEQAEFRAEVRAFLTGNAQPKRETSPWTLMFHRSADDARAAFERGRAWQGTLFAHRLAGMTYPVEFGGRGATSWHERIYSEEAVHYDVSSRFVGRHHRHARPDADEARHRRAEGALRAPIAVRRVRVLPAVQRARRRQRPGRSGLPSGPRR